MANLQLPSGAYLISNKQTGTCLECRGDRKEVRTATQDALHGRERQIWWVEVLPEHEDDVEGPMYSIHNLPDQLALDAISWFGKGNNVFTGRIHGQLWQMWWIKRVLDDNEGEFYNIIDVQAKGALDIDAKSEPLNSTVCTSEFAADNHRQRWEFIIPTVAIPAGWVQIRSASDRSFLQQTYITSPPFLAPELAPSTSLSDRKIWGSQWLLLLEDGKADSPQCYWSIKNRLTGGFLGHWNIRYKNGKITNVNAGETWRHGANFQIVMWRFQMQRDGYWNIINKGSSWVLERAECEDVGVRIVKRDSSDSERRKWEFVEWRNRVCQDCKAVEAKPPAYREFKFEEERGRHVLGNQVIVGE